MRRPIPALAVAFLTAGLVTIAEAQFTCSTVTRAGLLDPDGVVLSNSFRDEVAINAAGDALFVAKGAGARDKLYFYPSAGAGQVVARSDGPAPNGGVFRSQRAFFSLSLNDADDAAFFAQLVSGQGVFVRDGGVLETAAVRSQASPSGGVFDTFTMVGDIDALSQVPFVAQVDGGSSGAFLYSAVTDAVSSLVLDEAATLDGREVCETLAVDVVGATTGAIRAVSKVDCSDGGETARTGIFLLSGLGLSTIVLDGDASPIGGSTFAKFLDTPQINASGDVAFRASTVGTTKTDAVFVWDSATDTISVGVRKGDAAPGVGGAIAKNNSFDFADTGDVFLNARVQTSSARFGVFRFGLTDEAVLTKVSPVPTDAFGFGSKFTRLSTLNGTSSDGQRVGIAVRVKDTVQPPAKAGVLRCAGSPSGAFVDGEAFL